MNTRRKILAAGGAGLLGGLGGLLAGCGGGNGDAATAAATDRSNALGLAQIPPRVTSARVIIVGGGMAGVTLAKYLRLWGGTGLQITLVERNTQYTSNIMSSLVLTGQRTLASLQYRYDTLRTRYGINVVVDDVVALDPAKPSVTLRSGARLSADRVVLAPGIDFDEVPGLTDPDAMPHAWKAGPQTTILANQLAAMPSNGVVVLTIPKVPYRCPPGPYERACLLADWLKLRKPQAKLIVLDANPDIVIEQDNFGQAFFGLHANVIDYRTNVDISSVDVASRTLFTNQGPVQGHVVNLIPRQRAGGLVAASGLANANEGRFAAVDVLSYASTEAPRVHVLGDASATTQPKAGHIANQEAKVCADALVRIFAGGAPDPAPVTNSACYSTITMNKASWLNAVFQYSATTRTMVPVAAAGGASVGWNGDHFEDMGTWFNAVMADTFA
jgi:sulfide dehydrogenase [flavocytochrome c] flavoprotein subunit